MFTRKDRKIRNQKVMIENRDRLIKDLREQVELKNEQLRDLRYENSELADFKNKIKNIMKGKGIIVDKYDKINEVITSDETE